MGRYRLPPFSVQQVSKALSESMDWGLTFTGVPEHWKTTKGEGVNVAVLDTGIDDEHPDLASAIDKARDFTRSRYAHRDVQGHGTHCAGTIAARANGTGVIGVAPECHLFVGKVLDDSGSGDGAGISAGIDWACDEGADIISISAGSPQPDPRIGAALERAIASGKFVIVAAGNDGRPNSVNYPARWKGQGLHPNLDCIAVSAFRKDGRLADFSSRGPEVDVAGPGQDVLSTYLRGGYAKLSGTSMATPFVAGVVALMLAVHRKIKNAKTPLTNLRELREHFAKGSKEAGKPGKDDDFGFGLVDPDQLLKLEADGDAAQQPVLVFGEYGVFWPGRERDEINVSIGKV